MFRILVAFAICFEIATGATLRGQKALPVKFSRHLSTGKGSSSDSNSSSSSSSKKKSKKGCKLSDKDKKSNKGTQCIECAPGGIIITELLYNPDDSASDSDGEWIEILNYSCERIDLTGWILRDLSDEDGLAPYNGGSPFLGPGEYALIVDNNSPLASTFETEGFKVFTTNDNLIGNKLNNGGDTVQLLDSMSNIVEAVVYCNTDSSGCGNEANNNDDTSLERVDPLGPGDCSNFASQTNGGNSSPGEDNSVWVGPNIPEKCKCGVSDVDV